MYLTSIYYKLIYFVHNLTNVFEPKNDPPDIENIFQSELLVINPKQCIFTLVQSAIPDHKITEEELELYVHQVVSSCFNRMIFPSNKTFSSCRGKNYDITFVLGLKSNRNTPVHQTS